jgi:uncharacterized protein YbjT (DUF2867 family)
VSTVAVFGASGQTGHRIVDRLADDGRSVRAIARRRMPSAGRDQGVESAVADLTRASVAELASLLVGVDAVVFAAAGDPLRVDRDGALRVIEAAERAGARRFVLISGMGVGRDRPAEYYGGFWSTYFGAKETSERGLRASGLDWTILQPGELLNRTGTGRVQLAATGALPIGAIPRDDVAAVVAAIIDDEHAIRRTWELVEGRHPIADAVAHAI